MMMINPRKFMVSYREIIEAESVEGAAREFDRLMKTGRPTTYDVTPSGPSGGTVFVKVTNDGTAERVA